MEELLKNYIKHLENNFSPILGKELNELLNLELEKDTSIEEIEVKIKEYFVKFLRNFHAKDFDYTAKKLYEAYVDCDDENLIRAVRFLIRIYGKFQRLKLAKYFCDWRIKSRRLKCLNVYKNVKNENINSNKNNNENSITKNETLRKKHHINSGSDNSLKNNNNIYDNQNKVCNKNIHVNNAQNINNPYIGNFERKRSENKDNIHRSNKNTNSQTNHISNDKKFNKNLNSNENEIMSKIYNNNCYTSRSNKSKNLNLNNCNEINIINNLSNTTQNKVKEINNFTKNHPISNANIRIPYQNPFDINNNSKNNTNINSSPYMSHEPAQHLENNKNLEKVTYKNANISNKPNERKDQSKLERQKNINSGNSVTIFDKLYLQSYKKNDEKLLNEEIKKLSELDECTFQPNLNKKNNFLVN